ncbi:hypothetical protein OnM2_071016 [Erysiphe neolycopersici]|uniref:Uncharacterized protein n=1 Tax=Erysiphe neolycopersici TaxID=212602 RepID=A0A420HKC7_9PEZI|nr:hypothetical protein OnM2_071016 [Erysiphe neolycopersici]
MIRLLRIFDIFYACIFFKLTNVRACKEALNRAADGAARSCAYPHATTINPSQSRGLDWLGLIVDKFERCWHACVEGFQARNPNHVPTASMTNLSPENGLTGADKHTHGFYLHSMRKNIARHPTGGAAQMLTRVIRHVVEVTGDTNIRLSQATQYARLHGIVGPDAEVMDSDLDVADQSEATVMALARAEYYRKFGWYP